MSAGIEPTTGRARAEKAGHYKLRQRVIGVVVVYENN